MTRVSNQRKKHTQYTHHTNSTRVVSLILSHCLLVSLPPCFPLPVSPSPPVSFSPCLPLPVSPSPDGIEVGDVEGGVADGLSVDAFRVLVDKSIDRLCRKRLERSGGGGEGVQGEEVWWEKRRHAGT